MAKIHENAAASLIAHIETLRREKAYIAGLYAEYEGLKPLEAALAEAGVLNEVKAIIAEKECVPSQ